MVRNWPRLWAVVAAALVAAGVAWAAEPFEGKVRFEVTAAQAAGKQITMEYWIKKDKIRMDTKMEGMETYTLIYPAEKKMCTVMPAQKMVMEMAIPDVPAGTEAKKPDISRTGKIEKVNFVTDGATITAAKEGGKTYEGEQWLVKMEKMTSELWVAKDLAALAGFAEAFKAMAKNPNTAWAQDVNLGGFPYRVVTKNHEGETMSEMRLIQIDTTSPDDALFTIPADFKKIEMPKIPIPKQE